MADILQMLLDKLEEVKVGEKGSWTVNEGAKTKLRDLVTDLKVAAIQVANNEAKNIAALATDLMMDGIDEGALKILAQGGGGFAQGTFVMEEGDDKFGYSLSNDDVTLHVKKMKFNPADSGRFGKFGEQFLFGLESEAGSEAKFPDLMKLAEKYGDAIKILAPELKAISADSIHVGKVTIDPSSTKWVRDVKETWTETIKTGYVKAHTINVQDPITFRNKKVKVDATWGTKEQEYSKITSEWKLEVDSFVQRAIAVIKLLQKVSSLMVLETNDLGIKDGKRHFEFEAATIFAKLDVEKVIAGLDVDSNTKRTSFNVTVDADATMEGTGDGKKFNGKGATIHVSITNPSKKMKDGSFNMGDYRDKYSLWADKKSRDLFFVNMYKYLKDNDMFADAKRGSAQEEFNMNRAVARMRRFQGKT